VRTWPGLAAIGAGLIHLGSAAGTGPATLVPLVLVGTAELLWGVVALSRPVPPAPRAGAAGAGAVLLLTVVALLLPPSAMRHGSHVDLGVPAVAFGGAGVLVLAVGVLLAVHLGGVQARTGASSPPGSPQRSSRSSPRRASPAPPSAARCRCTEHVSRKIHRQQEQNVQMFLLKCDLPAEVLGRVSRSGGQEPAIAFLRSSTQRRTSGSTMTSPGISGRFR
jgi:hypothetical protein